MIAPYLPIGVRLSANQPVIIVRHGGRFLQNIPGEKIKLSPGLHGMGCTSVLGGEHGVIWA